MFLLAAGRGGGGRGGGRGRGDRVQGGWGEAKQQFRGDTGWSSNAGTSHQAGNAASGFFGGDQQSGYSGHGGYDDGRPRSGGRGGRRGGRGGRW